MSYGKIGVAAPILGSGESAARKQKIHFLSKAWFARWLNKDKNQTIESNVVYDTFNYSGSYRSSITFTIYSANGGFVIQHNKHERNKDSNGPELTIVNSHDEIGKTIEHIMAIESLRG